MSEQATRACNIFRVIATISGSRVFKAAKISVRKLSHTLYRNDELGNNWEDLGSTFLKHVKNSLDCKETVGILLFSDPLKEDGEVMVIVKLLNFYFPVYLKLGSVLDGDRKVSAVVEAAEFR